MSVRVLIVDDHPIFVGGLISVLEARAGFQVVARAERGAQALGHLRSMDIDVAISDISMPEMGGFELVAAARAEGLPARFILLTMHDEPAYLRRARELGVCGYVLKDAAVDDIVQAVQCVMAGKSFVSAAMVDGERRDRAGDQPLDLSCLTETERAVLRELARNHTSREIAELLSVSPRTVQNHRANICSKLGLRGSNRLLQFALENRHRF